MNRQGTMSPVQAHSTSKNRHLHSTVKNTHSKPHCCYRIRLEASYNYQTTKCIQALYCHSYVLFGLEKLSGRNASRTLPTISCYEVPGELHIPLEALQNVLFAYAYVVYM